MEFKDILKSARQYAGMTQQELADKIGVTAQVISNMERGVTQGVTIDRIKDIAKALGVDSEVLMEMKPVTGDNFSGYEIDKDEFPFSARVRQVCKDEGITESEFMRKTGFSKQEADAYLHGNRVPSAEAIIKISGALNVSTDYLLGKTDRRRLTMEEEVLLQTITSDERKLLRVYRELDEDRRDVLMGEAKKALIEQRREDAVGGKLEAK